MASRHLRIKLHHCVPDLVRRHLGIDPCTFLDVPCESTVGDVLSHIHPVYAALPVDYLHVMTGPLHRRGRLAPARRALPAERVPLPAVKPYDADVELFLYLECAAAERSGAKCTREAIQGGCYSENHDRNARDTATSLRALPAIPLNNALPVRAASVGRPTVQNVELRQFANIAQNVCVLHFAVDLFGDYPPTVAYTHRVSVRVELHAGHPGPQDIVIPRPCTVDALDRGGLYTVLVPWERIGANIVDERDLRVVVEYTPFRRGKRVRV